MSILSHAVTASDHILLSPTVYGRSVLATGFRAELFLSEHGRIMKGD